MMPLKERLDKHANGTISDAGQKQLIVLRTEADRFMIRKVQAAAVLSWREHKLPPEDRL